MSITTVMGREPDSRGLLAGQIAITRLIIISLPAEGLFCVALDRLIVSEKRLSQTKLNGWFSVKEPLLFICYPKTSPYGSCIEPQTIPSTGDLHILSPCIVDQGLL